VVWNQLWNSFLLVQGNIFEATLLEHWGNIFFHTVSFWLASSHTSRCLFLLIHHSRHPSVFDSHFKTYLFHTSFPLYAVLGKWGVSQCPQFSSHTCSVSLWDVMIWSKVLLLIYASHQLRKYYRPNFLYPPQHRPSYPVFWSITHVCHLLALLHNVWLTQLHLNIQCV